MGVRVCGRMGVLVSGCLFSVHICLPLPALGACLPASDACQPRMPACLGCLHANLHQTEFVVNFLASLVRVDSVSQCIHVGSRIGHSHSEMEGSRPAAPALSQTTSGVSRKTHLNFIRKGSCDLATDEPMATCVVRVVRQGTNVATNPAGGSFEC